MEEGTVYTGAVDGMIACPLQTMSRWFPASPPIFCVRIMSSKAASSSGAVDIHAADHRPWVEKYRPKDMSDLLGHEDITRTSA